MDHDNYWESIHVRELIGLALREDIGSGDVTTRACVPSDRQGHGQFFAKQDLVLAGVELLPTIYGLYGDAVEVELERGSGDSASTGERVAQVLGSARTLLTVERTALNFLQRLSGVATLARRYAEAIAHTNCRVLDTRKTTPGWRVLEKMAVAAGGASNHRIGLFDAILIKNNHIDAAGGVAAALDAALSSGIPVEIEIRNRAELDEALAHGATHVLLDNLTPTEARREIEHIAGRALVELSGGVNLATVARYAETGANFVSCGAMTHSAVAVDLNFRLSWA